VPPLPVGRAATLRSAMGPPDSRLARQPGACGGCNLLTSAAGPPNSYPPLRAAHRVLTLLPVALESPHVENRKGPGPPAPTAHAQPASRGLCPVRGAGRCAAAQRAAGASNALQLRAWRARPVRHGQPPARSTASGHEKPCVCQAAMHMDQLQHRPHKLSRRLRASARSAAAQLGPLTSRACTCAHGEP
jgi:hypothetical protein